MYGAKATLEISGCTAEHVIRFLRLTRREVEVAELQVATDILGTHIVLAIMLLHPGQGAEEKRLCGRLVTF